MITRIEDLVSKIHPVPVKGATSEGSLSRFTITGSTSITKALTHNYYGYELISDNPPKDIEVDLTGIDDLVKECDPNLLIDLKRRAELMMSDQFPVYFEFYQSCLIVEDKNAGTAYIMFNELLGEYEIHYNPEFILEKIVTDASIWGESDLENSMVKSFLFVLMHEMMHALRYHMANQMSAVSNTPLQIINIMGDSFINTELQKTLNIPVLYNCIDSKVTFGGKLSRNLDARVLSKELKTWFSSLVGKSVRVYDDPSSDTLKRGEQVTITVYVGARGQEVLFGKNSNLYIMELERFLQRFFMVESAESGNGKGKESASSGQSPSQSSGDSGSDQSTSSDPDTKSGTGSSGGKGSDTDVDDTEDDDPDDMDMGDIDDDPVDSDSSGGSGSGSGSGNSTTGGQGRSVAQDRSMADASLGSSEAAQKARSNLEEAIQKAGNKNEEALGESEALLKSIGADKLARNFKNVQTWKSKLNKYLTDCLSTTERYNSELANARIEGQYGREEDVNVPKRIILAFDCSGSMGPEKFKQVMAEVENFLLANKYKHIEIIVIYWGSSTPEVLKLKLNKGLGQRIMASAKSLGGTLMYSAIDLVKEKYRKFDMLIIFTDGEIESTPKEDTKAFLRRVSSRTLYVLTKGGYTKSILKYDSGAARRIIQAK